MWRRSWLSREVLLFGLFFCALLVLTLLTCADHLPAISLSRLHLGAIAPMQHAPITSLGLSALGSITAALGVAGIVASAFIYLVPARPAWNMLPTPIDFLLSAVLIGTTLPSVLIGMLSWIFPAHSLPVSLHIWPAAVASLFWITNQTTRLVRLIDRRSSSGARRQHFCICRGFALP